MTRYRYGDEQHLDEALDRIFRFNKVPPLTPGRLFLCSQGMQFLVQRSEDVLHSFE